MKRKMMIALTLVCMLAITSTVGATAMLLPENQSNGTTTMQLDITPAQLSVEVPLSISFSIDKNGGVVAPTAILIENKSFAPVYVVSATVIQSAPWSIIAIDSDFTTKNVDTKDFAFSLKGQGAVNNTSFNTSGFITMEATDTAVENANKLSLAIASVTRIAPQRQAATAQDVAQLVFVFDFK